MDGQGEAETLAETPDEEPLHKRLPSRSLDREVDGDAEERIGKPTVRRGFSGDDMS
jgi:hypothetical protein